MQGTKCNELDDPFYMSMSLWRDNKFSALKLFLNYMNKLTKV